MSSASSLCICNEEKEDDLILCNSCKVQHHHICVKINKEISRKFNRWYCNRCLEEKDVRITYKRGVDREKNHEQPQITQETQIGANVEIQPSTNNEEQSVINNDEQPMITNTEQQVTPNIQQTMATNIEQPVTTHDGQSETANEQQSGSNNQKESETMKNHPPQPPTTQNKPKQPPTTRDNPKQPPTTRKFSRPSRKTARQSTTGSISQAEKLRLVALRDKTNPVVRPSTSSAIQPPTEHDTQQTEEAELDENNPAEVSQTAVDQNREDNDVRIIAALKHRPKRAQKKKTSNNTRYYPFKKIIRMIKRGKPRKRYFELLWEDKTISEVPEDDMGGSVDQLNKWLKKNHPKEPPTTTKPLDEDEAVGATETPEGFIDTENLVSIDKVIEMIHKLGSSQRRAFKKAIPVAQYKGEELDHDIILILAHEMHCYVIAHLHDEDINYIADGGNNYINDESTREEIQKKLKTEKLIPLSFNHEKATDHCGSSGVLIAVEFMRCYQSNRWLPHVIVPKWDQEFLIKTWHKEESHPATSWKPISENLKNLKKVCPFCNFVDFKRNKRNFTAHLLRCPAKQ